MLSQVHFDRLSAAAFAACQDQGVWHAILNLCEGAQQTELILALLQRANTQYIVRRAELSTYCRDLCFSGRLEALRIHAFIDQGRLQAKMTAHFIGCVARDCDQVRSAARSIKRSRLNSAAL
jgi:hypothetical protein